MENRYLRQTSLDDVGIQGQEKLHQSSVLIIGMGGLGCPAVQFLAAAGVGNLGLMDFDVVNLTNLHRQVLFTENDLGRKKVIAAAERISKLNSEIQLKVIEDKFSTDNAIKIIKSFDLILDCTDNIDTKYLINDACVKMDKPWIYASVYKFQGQIAVFNYQNGPTLRCIFPKLDRSIPSCEEIGTMGTVPGILGTMQANEALKMILGIGQILSGKMKIMDFLNHVEQTVEINKNENLMNKIRVNALETEQFTCQLKDQKSLYLDVRENGESPPLQGANLIKIPLSEIENRFHEIPKDEEVFVFCLTGRRSREAINILRSKGLNNLKNVHNGIKAIIHEN